MGFIFNTVIALIFVAVALILGAAVLDGVYSYRAEPATIACHQKQMDSMRLTFTDSVVCVPYPMRRDSTTVQVIQ